jgi:hypothetical protein
MAVQEGPRFGARSLRRGTPRRVHWGWLGLSALPIGALLADRHLPAPWVIGLAIAAGVTILFGFGLPQRAWGWTSREIVGGLRGAWEVRQREEAKEMLQTAATSLDQLVDIHAPSRGHKALPFSSQRYRRSVVLRDYEPLGAEVELAVSAAMRAGARDDGTMLLATQPRGLRDLTALLAELRRMTIELS